MRYLLFWATAVAMGCTSNSDSGGVPETYAPSTVVDNTCYVPAGDYLSIASVNSSTCSADLNQGEKNLFTGLKTHVPSQSKCGSSSHSSSQPIDGTPCNSSLSFEISGSGSGLKGSAQIDVSCPSTYGPSCSLSLDVDFLKK